MSTVKIRNFVKFEKNTKMKSILKIVMVLVVFSCGNDKNNKRPIIENQEEQITASTYKTISEELLKNSKFKSWDTNAKPTDWEINEDFDKPEDYVIDRDTLDLLLVGHKDKLVFIEQKIKVEPNSYYLFDGDFETRLKHNSYSGIKFTNERGEEIGKKVFEKAEKKKYKIIFNSLKSEEITCYIGFLLKGEGQIMIKSFSMKKVELNNTIFESELAQEFYKSIRLDIEDNYDESISKIVEQLSNLLLADRNKDTINIKNKNRIISLIENEESYLKRILLEPGENATKSFATKLVYGSSEILEHFNIGSRVIEFRANNKRVHLALMYYNPFLNEWVTIDPFYNSKINANSNLESITKEQVIPINYGGLITNDIEGLLQKYRTSKAIIQKETIMSYPF